MPAILLGTAGQIALKSAIVAVLAHVLWNEPLRWPQLGGIVLIGSAVLLIHQH